MYKVFSTLFKLALFLSFTFNANACGWYMPDESLRFSLFNAELFQDRSHRPLYFSMNFNGYDAVMLSKDEHALAQEWKKELKLKSSAEEIQSYFFGGLSRDALKTHPFAKELARNNELEQFLSYAKSCEFAISVLDPWSESDFIQRQEVLPELIAQGEKLIKRQKKRFWKKKYAFQLLRLTFYNDQDDSFLHYYKTWFGAGKEKTTLDWWATHYYSQRIGKRQKPQTTTTYGYPEGASKTAYSNYLHAMVFRHSSNKAYISKRLYMSIHFNQQLTYAKNNEEIASLYLMKHLQNPFIDLNAIDSIVKYDPDHPQLKLILTRELNKFELQEGKSKYFVYRHGFRYFYTNFSDEVIKVHDVATFKQQVENMTAWKRANKDQYHLFMTHLNILLRNMDEAQKSLDKVKTKDKDLLFQKHIYATCILTSSKNIQSNAVQDEIAEHLFFLLENREGIFESDRLMYSLCSYLSVAFESRKLNHFAGIFSYYAKTKFTTDGTVYSPFDFFDEKTEIAGTRKLIEIFGKKHKNKLEEFTVLPFENDYNFRMLLSRMYLRTGQTRKAYNVIRKVPDIFWSFEFGQSETLESDPFKLVVVPHPNQKSAFKNDVDDQEHRRRSMALFTRKKILSDMDSLEKLGETGNPEALLALGNAWYNFSSVGKNWQVMSYFTTLNPGPHLTKLNSICYRNARRYYHRTLKNGCNREQEAHSRYMLALIAREQDNRKEYVKLAKAFEQLKNTKFYQGINCVSTKNGRYGTEKTQAEFLKGKTDW